MDQLEKVNLDRNVRKLFSSAFVIAQATKSRVFCALAGNVLDRILA